LSSSRGIDDKPLVIVDLHARQRSYGRSRRNDDVPGGNSLTTNLDRVRTGEARSALQPVNLVLLEQELDPTGQALHGILALTLHGVEVEAHLVDLDAQLRQRSASGFFVKLRRMQQRL
jgi:hypothetical protein